MFYLCSLACVLTFVFHVFQLCSFVFTCVVLVFTCVHLCSLVFYLCSFVFTCVLLVFICVPLVFICVPLVFIYVPFVVICGHLCSFVFLLVWCFRLNQNLNLLFHVVYLERKYVISDYISKMFI